MFDKVSQIMSWHYSLMWRLNFDLFLLNWQWFTIYRVLSFILLSSMPFLLLFSCKLLFSFLAFSCWLRGPEVLFKYNRCSFWLLEKLPKVKEHFLMSHENIWVFFPLFFVMRKNRGLRFEHCQLQQSRISVMGKHTPPTLEPYVSLRFRGKHRMTRGGWPVS